MRVKVGQLRKLVKEEVAGVMDEADLDEAGKTKKPKFDAKKFGTELAEELGIRLGQRLASQQDVWREAVAEVTAEARDMMKLPGGAADLADALRDTDALKAAVMKRLSKELDEAVQNAIWDLDDELGGAPPKEKSNFDHWIDAVDKALKKRMGETLQDLDVSPAMLKQHFQRGDEADVVARLIQRGG